MRKGGRGKFAGKPGAGIPPFRFDKREGSRREAPRDQTGRTFPQTYTIALVQTLRQNPGHRYSQSVVTATLVVPWDVPLASRNRTNTREDPGAKGICAVVLAKIEKVGVPPTAKLTGTDAAGALIH
jgi:hypothetical protein